MLFIEPDGGSAVIDKESPARYPARNLGVRKFEEIIQVIKSESGF